VAASPFNQVIRHLRESVLRDAGTELTDGQLLETFLADQKPSGLELLVQRHAPMVWAVCRRILLNHHDAEDAFQATFLVLVRRARAIQPREMVASWLYGVARQTALKARAMTARRLGREKLLATLPEPPVPEVRRSELLSRLDDILSGLPERYRTAIVLCDLEGRTRKEAARQLSVPEGTVAARLARGRRMLSRRLARQFAPVTAGAVAALLAEQAGRANVPTSLLHVTLRTALAVAAGHPAVHVSLGVAALTEGVLFAMTLTKVKTTVLLLFVCLLGAGLGAGTLAGQEQPAQAVPERRVDQQSGGADAENNSPHEDRKAMERRLKLLEVENQRLTRIIEALRQNSDAKLPPTHVPPLPMKIEVQILALRHVPANEAAKVLSELFSLSGIRIVPFPSTNSVVVQGTRKGIDAVADMIERLEKHAADRIRRSTGPRPPVKSS
jgi:RNA polymerase sigma factor (sigma-70 family)